MELNYSRVEELISSSINGIAFDIRSRSAST